MRWGRSGEIVKWVFLITQDVFSFSLLLLLWDPRCDSRGDGATTAPTFLCACRPLPLLQWKRSSTQWPECATAPPHPVAMPLATATADYWKWPPSLPPPSRTTPLSCLSLGWHCLRLWRRSPTHFSEMASASFSLHTHTNTGTGDKMLMVICRRHESGRHGNCEGLPADCRRLRESSPSPPTGNSAIQLNGPESN